MPARIEASVLGSTYLQYPAGNGRFKAARASFLSLQFCSAKAAPFRDLFLSLCARLPNGDPCRILQAYPYTVVDGSSFQKDMTSPFKTYHIMDNGVRMDWTQERTSRGQPPPVFLYLVVEAPQREVAVALDASYSTEASLLRRISPANLWTKRQLKGQLILESCGSEAGSSRRTSSSSTPSGRNSQSSTSISRMDSVQGTLRVLCA
jgi:hypothetical protein